MWITTFGLAVTLFAGKVSLTARETPLPEAMKALAAQLGSRLEIKGDVADLKVTLRMENEDPVRAVQRMLEGLPVDYYVLGRGQIILLQRRDRPGETSLVYQSGPPLVAAGSGREAEVDRAVDFLSKLGELNPEETRRLRQELMRNW